MDRNVFNDVLYSPPWRKTHKNNGSCFGVSRVSFLQFIASRTTFITNMDCAITASNGKPIPAFSVILDSNFGKMFEKTIFTSCWILACMLLSAVHDSFFMEYDKLGILRNKYIATNRLPAFVVFCATSRLIFYTLTSFGFLGFSVVLSVLYLIAGC